MEEDQDPAVVLSRGDNPEDLLLEEACLGVVETHHQEEVVLQGEVALQEEVTLQEQEMQISQTSLDPPIASLARNPRFLPGIVLRLTNSSPNGTYSLGSTLTIPL